MKIVKAPLPIYYEKSLQREGLRPFFVKALSILDEAPKVAMDLGCGVSKETVELLKLGCRVLAIDKNPQAIEILKSIAEGLPGQLVAQVIDFESIVLWPKVDLFYSALAMPFCRKEIFERLIVNSISTVNVGGLYAAIIFGSEDEWVVEGRANGITLDAFKAYFSGFDVIVAKEKKEIGKTAMGLEKFWHTIFLIARRKPPANVASDSKF